MYVFVEISFDTSHLIKTIADNFPPDCKLAVMGTIQFTSSVYDAYSKLKPVMEHIKLPQCKPLSSGNFPHVIITL